MLLSRSFGRRTLVTCGAACALTLFHQTTVFDSNRSDDVVVTDTAPVEAAAGRIHRFDATAYCKGRTTAAGTAARAGVVAADPAVLPLGSVVRVSNLGPRYDGVYTVMDTGPKVEGREIDLYMWSCREALTFGRRPVAIEVLRLGWNPRRTALSPSSSAPQTGDGAVAPAGLRQ